MDKGGRSALVEAWRRLRRNRLSIAGLVLIVVELVVAAAAPALAPYDPLSQDLVNRLTRPGAPGHPLGTDDFGRDILSRIMYGTRLSFLIGLVVVGIALAAGVPLGLLAGYYTRLDEPIMRLMDLMLAFPGILLALTIIAALGPGLFNVMLAVGIASVPAFARVVRSSTLTIRTLDYVAAARAVGGEDGRILLRHILPNVVGPLVVLATFRIATSILSAASLSFLGLGVRPPAPEWGAMLSDGRTFLYSAPHVATLPGVAIFVTVLAFNVLGDGVRDVLDPRFKE